MYGPVASLNTAWFALIGVLWTGYFVLEGFDFGVGMLSLVLGRDDIDRRMARSASGPWWDGNEVWLIVAAGATFAAFPVWYASMFSAFYFVLFLILAALIGRGVAFEFRGKRDSARWRNRWDVVLAAGSLIPAFAWGLAFTARLHGLHRARAGTALGRCRALRDRPGLPGAVPRALTAACALAFVVSGLLVRIGRAVLAFGLSALGIMAASAAIFAALFPRVLVSSGPGPSLTIWSAASANLSLVVMTVVAAISLPLVLLYQGWSYGVFRQRLTRPPDQAGATAPQRAPGPAAVAQQRRRGA